MSHGIPDKIHCVWWEVNKTLARSPLFHEDKLECSSYKSSKDNPSLWVGNHQQIRVYVGSGSQWVSVHFQTSVENKIKLHHEFYEVCWSFEFGVTLMSFVFYTFIISWDQKSNLRLFWLEKHSQTYHSPMPHTLPSLQQTFRKKI